MSTNSPDWYWRLCTRFTSSWLNSTMEMSSATEPNRLATYIKNNIDNTKFQQIIIKQVLR